MKREIWKDRADYIERIRDKASLFLEQILKCGEDAPDKIYIDIEKNLYDIKGVFSKLEFYNITLFIHEIEDMVISLRDKKRVCSIIERRCLLSVHAMLINICEIVEENLCYGEKEIDEMINNFTMSEIEREAIRLGN